MTGLHMEEMEREEEIGRWKGRKGVREVEKEREYKQGKKDEEISIYYSSVSIKGTFALLLKLITFNIIML